ncbi:MAG: DUF4058 family protein [Planctomycetes bacterium]|nr:DUF4058 family protein [Planctomycetota bacterium]
MPVHDWTMVPAGIFHHFHVAWVNELSNTLNDGLLPPGYYALAEQVTRPFGPDVLTLQTNRPTDSGNGMARQSVALLEKPPRARVVQESDADLYAKKANRIAIRHASDDRVIALVEVLSPGNKSGRHAIDSLLEKVWSALDQGIHLLLIDLFPPTPRDPEGIHRLIWDDSAPLPPADQPLTLAAYQATQPRRAFVEPTAVGLALIDMPLFLDAEHYVPVPLETTYQAAWRGVPQRWKSVLLK